MKKKPTWKETFRQVIKEHNPYKANGRTVAAYATRQRRVQALWKGFRDLRQMGFKFNTVKALRGKHIEALVKHWEASGLSASTMQFNLSTFRTFAHWIEKPSMVQRLECYVSSQSLPMQDEPEIAPTFQCKVGLKLLRDRSSYMDEYQYERHRIKHTCPD